MLPSAARGADGTWKVDNGGNWSAATNWTSDPAVPNGVGETARFLNVINLDRIITQDVAGLTLGAIEFDDNNSYLIGGGGVGGSGGSPITLDASAGNATVTVNTANGSAAHTIAANLVLNDTVQVTTNAIVGLPLTFSGAISGSGGLIKSGSGRLRLGGSTANTFGGDVTVNQGTLDLFKTTAATDAIGGNLIVGDDVGGANADIAITSNSAIPSTSTVTINSSGQLQVAAADAVQDVVIKGGSITIAGGGGFFFIFGQLTTLAHANVATISGTGDLRTSIGAMAVADGAAANDLVISAPITQGGLNKQGLGTLVLTGSNTYTNATIINAGTLQVGNGGTTGTLGGTSFGISNNGTLALNRSNAVLVSNAISGIGGVSQLGTGTTTLSGTNTYVGATLISTGTLQIGNGGATGTLGSGTGAVTNNGTLAFSRNNVLPVANDISGSGNVSQLGTGTTTLSGVLTYTGATTASAGKLILDTSLTSSASLSATGSTIELAGNGTSMRVIKTSSVSTAGSGKIDLKDNKLIVNAPGQTGSFNGSVYTGVTGLIASGKGTSNTWNGSTGIVTSQSAAVGTNFTTLGVAKGSEVKSNSVSETALWAGQTITGTDTLVMYTYGGDATLDGKINIDDYVKIDSGIAGGYTGWSNGDFNYDGKVSIDDYITVIDANIGNQNGVVFPTASGVQEVAAAVPEPGGIAVPSAGMFLLTVAAGRRTRMLASGRTRRTPTRAVSPSHSTACRC
jgi:autotransporter-associated beta strand protein